MKKHEGTRAHGPISTQAQEYTYKKVYRQADIVLRTRSHPDNRTQGYEHMSANIMRKRNSMLIVGALTTYGLNCVCIACCTTGMNDPFDEALRFRDRDTK